ncbi:hypothetical protein KSS87_008000 [Heliosperma pusillum]|nr:hypothetical protein KSS87_008000 [Heliosperma pusillum]
MLESKRSGSMLEVLQHMLFEVQVRSFRYLWQQAPVPLLQGHEEQQGQAQVPLISTHLLFSSSLLAKYGLRVFIYVLLCCAQLSLSLSRASFVFRVC